MPEDDRQREHQANERTFLAWVRTSLSLIGIGLALARFSLFIRQISVQNANQPYSTDITAVLGAGMVSMGIAIIGLGLWEYNRAYRQIEADVYIPNRLMVWSVAIAVGLLGLLSLPLAIWRSANHRNVEIQPQALPTPEQTNQ
ncbi:MAG: YidH family protein [Synechococcus sp.]